MKIRYRHIYFTGIVFTVIFLWGCSPSHVLYQTLGEKEAFTYLDFQRNHKTYEISDSIDSSLVKTIKVLGFAGDKYLIELSPEIDELSFEVAGSGFDIRLCTDHMNTVLIRERESLFSITVNGPSGTDYDLKITRL